MAQKLTAAQRRILAYTALGEASSLDGMEAVAAVIKNRADSGMYSSDPAAVALQSNVNGIHQFSTWNSTTYGGNNPTKIPTTSTQYKTALQAIDNIFSGTVDDPTGGSLSYIANGSAEPSWFAAEASGGTKVIGGNKFAVPAPKAQPGLQDLSDAAMNGVTGVKGNKTISMITDPVLKQVYEASQAQGAGSVVDDRLSQLLAPAADMQPSDGGLTSHAVKLVQIDPISGQPVFAPTGPKANSSGSPDDRGSGALPITENVSGSPDDRDNGTAELQQQLSTKGYVNTTSNQTGQFQLPPEYQPAVMASLPAAPTQDYVGDTDPWSYEYRTVSQTVDPLTAPSVAINSSGSPDDRQAAEDAAAAQLKEVADGAPRTITKVVRVRVPNQTPRPVPVPVPTVKIATGKVVPVGSLSTGGVDGAGNPFTYTVNSDGSITNNRGQVTATASGPVGVAAVAAQNTYKSALSGPKGQSGGGGYSNPNV